MQAALLYCSCSFLSTHFKYPMSSGRAGILLFANCSLSSTGISGKMALGITCTQVKMAQGLLLQDHIYIDNTGAACICACLTRSIDEVNGMIVAELLISAIKLMLALVITSISLSERSSSSKSDLTITCMQPHKAC